MHRINLKNLDAAIDVGEVKAGSIGRKNEGAKMAADSFHAPQLFPRSCIPKANGAVGTARGE